MKLFNMITRCFRSAVSFAFLFVALQAFDVCGTVRKEVGRAVGAVSSAVHWLYGEDEKKDSPPTMDPILEAYYLNNTPTLVKFHDAARSGNLQKVKNILKKNFDSHTVDNLEEKANAMLLNSLEDGTTALYKAIMHGFEPVAKFLMEQKGIDIGITRKQLEALTDKKTEDTVLHMKAKNGDLDVVKALLLLLKDKVHLNAINKKKETPLYLAMHGYSESHKKITDRLLEEANVDLSTPSSEPMAALLLQQRGVNVPDSDKNISPLFLALKAKQEELAKLLIAKFGSATLDVTYKDPAGNTALHMAAKAGYTAVFERLIDKKLIDINAINTTNEAGETALYLASKAAKMDIVTLLLKQKGIDLSAPKGYRNILDWAVRDGYGGIVRLILQNHPNIDVNFTDKDGNTLLHLAVERGYKDVVRALLKAPGIDVNCQNTSKDTPLHVAVAKNDKGVVEILVAVSAIDVTIENNFFLPLGPLPPGQRYEHPAEFYKFTPIHLAAHNGYKDIFLMLSKMPSAHALSKSKVAGIVTIVLRQFDVKPGFTLMVESGLLTREEVGSSFLVF